MEQPLWTGIDDIKPNYILIYLRLSSFSLRIYPEAQLPTISNYIYTRLFLTALFIIAYPINLLFGHLDSFLVLGNDK